MESKFREYIFHILYLNYPALIFQTKNYNEHIGHKALKVTLQIKVYFSTVPHFL